MRMTAVIAAVVLAAAGTAMGQIIAQPVVAGVSISPEGVVSVRQGGARPAPKGAEKDASLTYVSLPRLFEELKKATVSGQAVSEDVRYVGGLTGIEYVFVYPAEHDLVIAGRAEPVDAGNALSPVGTVTGRPVMQLDDLIVAIRAQGERGKDFFGCSLDVPADYDATRKAIIAKFEKGPRDRLLAELKKGLPPQTVKLYGVPEDSRVALAMVGADYRLKRLSMGAETVAGVPTAVTADTAVSRLWFAPAYEPLRVSANGSAYQFRGPRLKVLAGAAAFHTDGASEGAKKFAETFSAKMPEIAKKIEGVADLQNIADEFLLGALIAQDKLGEKAGVDMSWVMNAGNYKPAALPVPKTAETQIRVIGQQLATGGVGFKYQEIVTSGREQDASLAGTMKRPAEGWSLKEVLAGEK